MFEELPALDVSFAARDSIQKRGTLVHHVGGGDVLDQLLGRFAAADSSASQFAESIGVKLHFHALTQLAPVEKRFDLAIRHGAEGLAQLAACNFDFSSHTAEDRRREPCFASVGMISTIDCPCRAMVTRSPRSTARISCVSLFLAFVTLTIMAAFAF